MPALRGTLVFAVCRRDYTSPGRVLQTALKARAKISILQPDAHNKKRE